MRGARSVAIVGGGPAGAALGTYLARAGVRVVLFDTGRRPPLIVGESLVPAITPILGELGIEREVAAISTYKPGATFYTTREDEVSFIFARAGRGAPRYAYNSPRDEFDSIVMRNAQKCGVTCLERRVDLEADVARDELRLDEATLRSWQEATGTERPDLIVDATGRSRVVARLLSIPSWEGRRKDVALFSHLRAIDTPHEGHIHINRLKRGWSWRIPLPGRVSLGVVIPGDALAEYGQTAEEQFDRLCREEPTLRSYARHATRLTSVMKYSNYQLNSSRWVGRNWALVGDAGGFIDPIFSSGLLLALEGAQELSRAILTEWSQGSKRYERVMRSKLGAWRDLIESYYDGRMFSIFRLRSIYSENRLVSMVAKVVDSQLALALSGVAPTSARRLWLLRFMLRWLGRSATPSRYRIT